MHQMKIDHTLNSTYPTPLHSCDFESRISRILEMESHELASKMARRASSSAFLGRFPIKSVLDSSNFYHQNAKAYRAA